MNKPKLAKVFFINLISQALPFLTVFYITRLYTPEDFSIFGSITSYAAFALVLCTLRLEHSLIQITDDTLKNKLVGSMLTLSFFISIVMSMIFSVLIMSFDFDIFLYCALLLLSMSSFGVITNYAVSEDNINGLLYIRLAKGFLDAFAPILTYWVLSDYRGLVIGLFISYILSISVMFLKNIDKFSFDASVLKEYVSKFSKYDVMNGALNAAANALPVIVITALHQPVYAGAFAFLNRYFAAVASFAMNSLGVVYRTSAMKEINQHGNFKKSTEKTIVYGFFMALAFLFIVAGFQYIGFEKILGPNWTVLNDISIIVGVLYAFKIVYLPIGYSFYIKGQVVKNLKIQIFLFAISLTASCACYLVNEFNYSVYIFCIMLSAFYAFNIFYVLKLSSSESTVTEGK